MDLKEGKIIKPDVEKGKVFMESRQGSSKPSQVYSLLNEVLTSLKLQ